MSGEDTTDDPRPLFSADGYRADSGNSYESHNDSGVYERDDGDTSADEVDPKKLVRQPTENDIRWYYQNGSLASTIVDKPVNDAYKHGFTVNESEDKRDFIDEVVDAYQRATRKARRDGWALVWFRLKDGTEGEWVPPRNVDRLIEPKVLTLDDMTETKPLGFEAKISAGNRDAVIQGVNESWEEMDDLRDVLTTAEREQFGADGHRLPRLDSDESTLALDDIDIGGGDVSRSEWSLRYGHSRFYEVTDDGIVISKRLDSERYEKPIGYLYDRGTGFDPLLIHPERVWHITYREDVDGDIEETTYGEWEGDSILRPNIHVLRAIHKGNWATAQRLFRDSAQLHIMSYEEGASDDNIDKADRSIRNINAKSSIMEPPGFELRTIDSSSDVEVGDSFDVLFDQLCAGTEFTRSVLFGQQAGTVSGSETDIKNYFNKVERDRENIYEADLRGMVNWYAQFDADDYNFESGLDMDWGPLFKLDELDQAEAMFRHVQLATQGVANYLLEPDEAKSILAEEWADWTEADISDEAPLDEGDLGRVEFEQSDQGNPAVGQNGGGRDEGDMGDSGQPTSN